MVKAALAEPPGTRRAFVTAACLDDDELRDAFAAMADADISADPSFWAAEGFELREIDTSFRFDDVAEAETLLGFFFGERGRRSAALEIGFRVALFTRSSRGA